MHAVPEVALDRPLNGDRRFAGNLCIALIKECAEIGEMSDTAHNTITATLKHLQQAEFWQLRNQERHAGKNASTDQQLAVCRVALPALEAAVKALEADDYDGVINHVTLAVTTDGSVPRKKSTKGLRRKVK